MRDCSAGLRPTMLEGGRDAWPPAQSAGLASAAAGGPLLQTWALAEAQGRPPRCGRGRDGLRMSPPEPQDLRGNVSVGVTSGDDAGSWLPPASL